MKRNKFEWSLKPLMVCMKFVLGCNLKDSKRTNIVVRFIVPALGLFYVFANLIVNGPCGLFSNSEFYNSKKFLHYKYTKTDDLHIDDIIYFIFDFVKFMTFLSTPLIHLIFMAKVILTRNWQDLWRVLQKINIKMKLDDLFHCTLRKHCLLALSIFILVSENVGL